MSNPFVPLDMFSDVAVGTTVFALTAATIRRRSVFTGMESGEGRYLIHGDGETPLSPEFRIGDFNSHEAWDGPVTYRIDAEGVENSGVRVRIAEGDLHFRLSVGGQMWRLWNELQNRPEATLHMAVALRIHSTPGGAHIMSRHIVDRITGTAFTFEDVISGDEHGL